MFHDIPEDSPREQDSEGNTVVHCTLEPYDDLIVTGRVRIDIILPKGHEGQGFKVKIIDSDVRQKLGERVNNATGELSVPWGGSCRYGLDVAFAAAREALKKTYEHPWLSSPRLPRAYWLDQGRQLPLVSSDTNTLKTFCGVGRTIGKRPYMEDSDFIFNSMKINSRRFISVYGVLDGHGGKDCAQFASDELPMNLVSNIRSGKIVEESLFKAFIDADKEFLSSDAPNSGCTGTVAVYDRDINEFVIAAVGDSRAVLSREGRAFDLTVDHKATLPEEVVRIAKVGGFVQNGRVMGCLAVARALGDGAIKRKGPMTVSAEPQFAAFNPCQGDEFVVIATDGLWDVFSSQAGVDHIRETLMNEGLLG